MQTRLLYYGVFVYASVEIVKDEEKFEWLDCSLVQLYGGAVYVLVKVIFLLLDIVWVGAL